jgi:hypothetical protein
VYVLLNCSVRHRQRDAGSPEPLASKMPASDDRLQVVADQDRLARVSTVVSTLMSTVQNSPASSTGQLPWSGSARS